MQTMNVSLTPELIKIVQSKVESGLYGNASEVIREAVRRMDLNAEVVYQLKLQKLKEALALGEADIKAGRTVPWTPDFLDKCEARARKKIGYSKKSKKRVPDGEKVFA